MHSTYENLLDEKLTFDEDFIKNASTEALNQILSSYLNLDYKFDESANSEFENKIVKYVQENIEINEKTKRIIVPALFDPKLEHLLSTNNKLAHNILHSNLKKLRKDNSKLMQYNAVIQDQLKNDIIERISNPQQFLKQNSDISFLAHNAVYRAGESSTKCRIVFLSNLFEKSKPNALLSHNNISIPGANLTPKMQTATILLRFDKHLLVYDLRKAFLQILLKEQDTKKLPFLWFRNIENNDFTVEIFRFLRLPFGLRFSSFLLAMALQKILITDAEMDDNKTKTIKKLINSLSYVDNLAFTSNSETELIDAFQISVKTFKQYGFDLQQFGTNSTKMQNQIEKQTNEVFEAESKLFGLIWNKKHDTIETRKPYLQPEAKTKRLILQTLQSNFDPFGMCLPMLNRAKLFVHDLQKNSDLGWDEPLDPAMLKQWANISKQVNNSAGIKLPRHIGDRNDTYNIITFTDSSQHLYGTVIYLQSQGSKETVFLLAKNRMVNKQLSSKSIPILELVALQLGVKTAIETYESLMNTDFPIKIDKIFAYTDSLIALNWIRAKAQTFSKIEKKAVFINNQLQSIVEICEKYPVIFRHIDGLQNPADAVTRCISVETLKETNFLSGPLVTDDPLDSNRVEVPHPAAKPISIFTIQVSNPQNFEPIIPLDSYSSFHKFKMVISKVMTFIAKMKALLYKKDPIRYEQYKPKRKNFIKESVQYLIVHAQKQKFQDVFEYFESNGSQPEVPIITQMNLFIDKEGLIRIESKLRNLKAEYNERCPILLDKNCPIAKSIIWDIHVRLGHAGVYKMISCIRKEFWITSCYSAVSKLYKECLLCPRLYNRTIKINQNAYKDYRLNPEKIPFRNCMVDHIGPHTIKNSNHENQKVYILIITCL